MAAPRLTIFRAEKMRIVINTLGSFGDIHPYIALAMELQSRGHVPVIATMEIYRERSKARVWSLCRFDQTFRSHKNRMRS